MLLSTFQWIEQTGLSKAINESLYAFAYIEAVHLLALAVLGGASLLVDLRLMGIAMTDQPVASLERVVRPWFRWSLVDDPASPGCCSSPRSRRASITVTTTSG